MNTKTIVFCGVSLVAMVAASASVFAQVQPNAGRVHQENKKKIETPKETKGIDIKAPKGKEAAVGGPEVTFETVRFEGNVTFSDEVLRTVIGEVVGKTFTFADMQSLADKVSAYYRAQGYPFGLAFLPKQKISDGRLVIAIVEGKLGESRIVGDKDLVERISKYLENFKSGDVISSSQLERITLLIDDLPGILQTPVMRPGKESGTGDLVISVERDRPYDIKLSVDNHGNRYTGKNRSRVDANMYGMFLIGDQVSTNLIYAGEGMKSGDVDYSLPIGSDGIRVNAGLNYTAYKLGKEYKDLQSSGTTHIIDTGLSYPLLRSQKTNLTVSGTFNGKWFVDETASTNTVEHKDTNSVVSSLSGDHRDAFLGGGITYGVFDWTYGHLNLDSELYATDALSAKTAGKYNKLNLTAARIQTLPMSFQFFGQISVQKAFNNLDSSEGFGLGGANGVRAYPSGEGYGDEGFVSQSELRYVTEYGAPFAFYDWGSSKINQDPWTAGNNKRHLGGFGVGYRGDYKGFSFEAVSAWRSYGGDPEADSKKKVPMIWLSASYKL